MAYKQVKNFVQARAGTRPYWCLANVRAGYGITNLLPDATTAWRHTEQHKDRNIPKGVAAPLFYSFTATLDGVRKDWGHINVRLPNGTIWNDGKIFSDLKSFEQAWTNIHYRGWGESVNNERVIKKEKDMYKGKTAKHYYKHTVKLDRLRKKFKKLYKQQKSYKETWRKRTLKLEAENKKLKNQSGSYKNKSAKHWYDSYQSEVSNKSFWRKLVADQYNSLSTRQKQILGKLKK